MKKKKGKSMVGDSNIPLLVTLKYCKEVEYLFHMINKRG